jgi:hypothetical protein
MHSLQIARKSFYITGNGKQESIVPLIRFDLEITHFSASLKKIRYYLSGALRWESPIRAERHE